MMTNSHSNRFMLYAFLLIALAGVVFGLQQLPTFMSNIQTQVQPAEARAKKAPAIKDSGEIVTKDGKHKVVWSQNGSNCTASYYTRTSNMPNASWGNPVETVTRTDVPCSSGRFVNIFDSFTQEVWDEFRRLLGLIK